MKRIKTILSVLLVGCLLGTLFPVESSASQEDKATFQGHSYQIFSGICETWKDAKDYCESLGGHLATISSQEENTFLHNFLLDAGYESAYFGLTDRAKEGEWVWVTGEPVTYTNWQPGEPNSENSNEDYAMFYYKFPNGTWNDGNFGNGTFLCEWDHTGSGEFRFTSNRTITCIPKNTTFDIYAGYYINDVLSKGQYQVSVSDHDVLRIDGIQNSSYGQCISLTTKKSGVAVLKIEDVSSGAVGSLELNVVNSEAVDSFENVPTMTFEEGKTTNFYNYSGMVVDDFQYKEARDANGEIEYYDVTMTIYNSLDIYGAVTSFDSAGNIEDYCVIDKFTTMDSSFIDSISKLIKQTGDLFYLLGNEHYYSGEGVTKRTPIEVRVPVGGYLEISNNTSSPVALFANITGLTIDFMATTGSLATSSDKLGKSKSLIIDQVLEEAFTKNYVNKAMVKTITELAQQELKNSDWSLSNFGDGIQDLLNVFTASGVDLLKLMTEEIASVTGIASLTESAVLDVLPTGDLINFLYTLSNTGQLILEAKLLNDSVHYPEGIYLYPSSFTDVSTQAYYSDPVQWASMNGITSGTSQTTFSPNDSCTRAQMVTFLWHAAGDPTPKSSINPFKDVAKNSYYYKAVLWAVENSVTGGTSATTFSPNETCTRAQAVTFLYNYAGKPTISDIDTPFKDIPNNAYYDTPVKWAIDFGVTSGTSATTFSPANNCTRGQIVTFLYNYLG